jgi:hypothetical protein
MMSAPPLPLWSTEMALSKNLRVLKELGDFHLFRIFKETRHTCHDALSGALARFALGGN